MKTGVKRKEASKKDTKGKYQTVVMDRTREARERSQGGRRCGACVARSAMDPLQEVEKSQGRPWSTEESWVTIPSQSNPQRSKFPFLLCSVLIVTLERE